MERKENRENQKNRENMGKKAELHSQQDFGVMAQCWRSRSFYCSTWILNGTALEKRGFLIIFFKKIEFPLFLLEFKEVQSYASDTEINPDAGKATGEDFHKRHGEQEIPTTSNTFKIHKINSVRALTRDERDFCSALGLMAGGSKQKIVCPEH